MHFALVAGALSSPRLQNTAYTAENIDDLLKDDVQRIMSWATGQRSKWKACGERFCVGMGRIFSPLGGWRTYVEGLISDDDSNVMALRGFLKDTSNKPTYSYDWTINDM